MNHPFLFFGAGDNQFYERIDLHLQFVDDPTEEQMVAIDAMIPFIYADDVNWGTKHLHVCAEWARPSIREMFPDPDQSTEYPTDTQRRQLEQRTEAWLHEVHAIAPLVAVYRPVDKESGGTKYSAWHTDSMEHLGVWLEEHDEPDSPNDMRRFVQPFIDMFLEVQKPLPPAVKERRSLLGILTNCIGARDETPLQLWFEESLTADELGYLVRHTPGGLNESIFSVFDTFKNRDDLSESFWDAIGKATYEYFGDPSSHGERTQEVWDHLQTTGVTKTHRAAPFFRALASGDDADFENALTLVGCDGTEPLDDATLDPIERKLKVDDSEAHRAFLFRLLRHVYVDEPDPQTVYSSVLFEKATRACAHEWTFENRSAELDKRIETLRALSPDIPTGALNTVAGWAYYQLAAKNFGTALCVYYIVCPNQEIHSSAHCNALYAVQVDNNDAAHQPEYARNLLADCLPQASTNLDIYFNAMAVWYELGELDETFNVLEQLAKEAILYDYDMDKIEAEPFFKPLREDPRWKAVFA